MSASLVGRLQTFVAREGLRLPVFSKVGLRVQQLAREERWTMEEVEGAIQSDQALAAEVLRAANSAFFGGLSPIHSVRAAVVRLGLPQVARLVLLASDAEKYRLRDPHLAALARKLARHAAATALAGQWLARRLDFAVHEDAAFLGGLLHDIGELAILAGLDALKAAEPVQVSDELVREVMETSHVELGVRLLEHWNLPDVFRRIVRDHHAPGLEAMDVPVSLVRLADQATRKVGLSPVPDPTIVLAATPDAHALRAGEVLLAELEVALEDAPI